MKMNLFVITDLLWLSTSQKNLDSEFPSPCLPPTPAGIWLESSLVCVFAWSDLNIIHLHHQDSVLQSRDCSDSRRSCQQDVQELCTSPQHQLGHSKPCEFAVCFFQNKNKIKFCVVILNIQVVVHIIQKKSGASENMTFVVNYIQ